MPIVSVLFVELLYLLDEVLLVVMEVAACFDFKCYFFSFRIGKHNIGVDAVRAGCFICSYVRRITQYLFVDCVK